MPAKYPPSCRLESIAGKPVEKQNLSFPGKQERQSGTAVAFQAYPDATRTCSMNKCDSLIKLVVCGAHMSGLPLNHQLTRLGSNLLEATRTAPIYRLFALAGEPKRPGLIRYTEEDGHAIDVEVWLMPATNLGAFSKLIPPPLCLGTVFLENGCSALGFLCEPAGISDAKEISHLGGWRHYLQNLEK